jgi:hypothetical protein
MNQELERGRGMMIPGQSGVNGPIELLVPNDPFYGRRKQARCFLPKNGKVGYQGPTTGVVWHDSRQQWFHRLFE